MGAAYASVKHYAKEIDISLYLCRNYLSTTNQKESMHMLITFGAEGCETKRGSWKYLHSHTVGVLLSPLRGSRKVHPAYPDQVEGTDNPAITHTSPTTMRSHEWYWHKLLFLSWWWSTFPSADHRLRKMAGLGNYLWKQERCAASTYFPRKQQNKQHNQSFVYNISEILKWI